MPHDHTRPSSMPSPDHRLSRAAGAALVLFLLLPAQCSLQRMGRSRRGSDRDFLFAAQFLYSYFIFQERLPADPFAFSSPQLLYRTVREPYTMYLPRDVARVVLGSLETRTTGLGVLLEPGDSGHVATAVHPASPAQKSGIARGDTILAIDNIALPGIGIEGLATLLRGEIGQVRDVVVGRPGGRTRLAVTMTSYLAPSVFTDSITSTVAYIYITSFLSTSESLKGTRREFVEALRRTSWATTILLDLRGNGGGELMQSVGVAAELLPAGAGIIRIVERVHDSTDAEDFTRDTVYRASADGAGKTRDVVVLTNEGTASGAELLIAALRTNRPGVEIVGSRTMGKGRAQVLALTPNSSLARVTNALLHPVRGKHYDEVGIEPTVAVPEPSIALQVATVTAQRGRPDLEPPSPESLWRVALLRTLYGPAPQAPLALYHHFHTRDGTITSVFEPAEPRSVCWIIDAVPRW